MAGFEGNYADRAPDPASRASDSLSPQAAPFDFVNESFEKLVGAAEILGANHGAAAVIDLYQRWIATQAGGIKYMYAAWFNLGAELNQAGDIRGAMLAYQTALALRPDFAPAAVNLGLLLERGGDSTAALATWVRATQTDEQRTSLLNHQARLLEKNGRLQEAEAQLRRSLLTTPMQPDVMQHWIHVRQKLCLWPVLDGSIHGLSVRDLTDHCGPLAALALFDSVAAQTDIAARWIARKTLPTGMRLSPAAGYRHDRLRIGYLSSDYCRHAMSFLIAELFERHDRTRFEIFGYCSTIDDNSEIRRRVIAAFDHFRPVRDLTDEAAARVIRADEIDILVDLNGLTQGSRIQVLRFRPAPVQATYLGFIGPVPLPELDYMFCDDVVVPPATAALYQPRPLYVAANYQANDSKRAIGAPTTRQAAGLPERGFVFCCFSNYYKITETMFAAWMEILRRVQGSLLWLVADNDTACGNLRRQAEAAGVDPARLLCAARVSPADYMARLAVADLFLDTFPYNAGTIASDALRMGLPMLTLAGEAFASRMAARLLTAMGGESGIVHTVDAYVERAVTWATDAGAYAAYRALFTEARWAATVGDIGRLALELEDTLARVALKEGKSVLF